METVDGLASAQRGLWFIQSLDPVSPAYLMCLAFDIFGEIDDDAMVRSVAWIVERHPVLRTAFEEDENGEPRTVVYDGIGVDFKFEDLSSRPNPDVEVEEVLRAESNRSFDLHCPPLLRGRLLTLGAARHVLVLVLHHIVGDDETLAVLLEELGIAYAAFRTGQQPCVSEAVDYREYVKWEREWLASDDYSCQVDYWRGELGGTVPIDLPHSGRPQAQVWSGGTLRTRLSTEETAAVLDFSRKNGATPFITLLSVFGGVLHRWTAQPDVVVGTSVSLRDQARFERTVGLLVNSVALRTRWDGDPSLRIAVEQVRRATFEALERRHVSLDQAAAALPELRIADGNPVFQVAFGFLSGAGGHLRGLQLAGLRAEPRWVQTSTSKFALAVDCMVEDDRLLCVLHWGERWFDQDLAELVLRHFTEAIRFTMREPDVSVGKWVFDPNQDAANGIPCTADWLSASNPFRATIEV